MQKLELRAGRLSVKRKEEQTKDNPFKHFAFLWDIEEAYKQCLMYLFGASKDPDNTGQAILLVPICSNKTPEDKHWSESKTDQDYLPMHLEGIKEFSNHTGREIKTKRYVCYRCKDATNIWNF